MGNVPFKDIRYAARSLDDLPNKSAYVLVFVDRDCPIAQRFMPEVVRLETAYIREWTIWKDLGLLLRTIPAVVYMRGAS